MNYILYLVISLVVYLLSSWWVMLVLGAVHLNSFAVVPALGFWQTFWVVLLIGAVGSVWNYSASITAALRD